MMNQLKFAAVAFLGGCILAADTAAGEWINLFDGKTLKGWVQRGGAAQYRVEDGSIVGRTALNTPNTFLCTEKDYSDFILELEFKVDPKLNSGVQIRSESAEEQIALNDPAGQGLKNHKGKPIKIAPGRVHGYQVEIDPSPRSWTGGIYDEGRRGWLQDLSENEPARKAFKQGEWNRFRIEARGDSLKTWINGVPAADLRDSMTSSGFIGLQVHGVGNDKTREGIEVRWRNLRLQELTGNP